MGCAMSDEEHYFAQMFTIMDMAKSNLPEDEFEDLVDRVVDEMLELKADLLLAGMEFEEEEDELEVELEELEDELDE
jgi:hypothetical protein